MKSEKLNPETISASEFRIKCLGLLDEVHDGKKRLIITKHGKPYADLVPHTPEPETRHFRPLFGRTPDVVILGDIVGPMFD